MCQSHMNADVEHDREDRMGDGPSARSRSWTCRATGRSSTLLSPSDQQDRREVEQQHVLDHVHRGTLLGERVDRRDQRDRQAQHAAQPRQQPPGLRAARAAARAHLAPARDVADREDEHDDDGPGAKRERGVGRDGEHCRAIVSLPDRHGAVVIRHTTSGSAGGRARSAACARASRGLRRLPRAADVARTSAVPRLPAGAAVAGAAALPALRAAGAVRVALPGAGAAFSGAWAPVAYAGAAPALVAALKFRGAVGLARLMAAQIAATAPPGLVGGPSPSCSCRCRPIRCAGAAAASTTRR